MKDRDSKVWIDIPVTGEDYHGLVKARKLANYRLNRLLKKDAITHTYEAEHEVLGNLCALRHLNPEIPLPTGFGDLYRHEARKLAQLQHPHIVGLVDAGRTSELNWLCMEYANGSSHGGVPVITLQDMMDAEDTLANQCITSYLITQAIDALDYAHSQGVVHGNLKPSSILIFMDGGMVYCKITDFGIAKLVGEEWLCRKTQSAAISSKCIDATGTIAGRYSSTGPDACPLLETFEYMSPEQKRGEEATAASDLYAMGLIAYRLLTGSNTGVMHPSKVNPRLGTRWDIFAEATLAENPSGRIASAEGAMLILDAIGDDIADSPERTNSYKMAAERFISALHHRMQNRSNV